MNDSVSVWGVPFRPLRLAEAVAAVCVLIEVRKPAYFITAKTSQGSHDEIGFNIHPSSSVSGIPLFHRMNRQIDLDLRD